MNTDRAAAPFAPDEAEFLSLLAQVKPEDMGDVGDVARRLWAILQRFEPDTTMH